MASKKPSSLPIIAAIVVSLLLIAGIAASFYFMYQHKVALEVSKSNHVLVRTHANGLNTQLKFLHKQLQKHANKTEVITAVNTLDYDQIKVLDEKITASDNDILFARLVPTRKAVKLRLSSQEIDFVDVAEKHKDDIHAEVVMDNGDPYFLISAPIPREGTLGTGGTLLIAHAARYLKDHLNTFDPEKGTVSLVETNESGSYTIVLSSGNVAPRLDTLNLFAIGDTRWSILFTPANEGGFGKNFNLYMILAALIQFILIFAVIFLAYRSRQTAIAALDEAEKNQEMMPTARKLQRSQLSAEDRAAAILAASGESDDKEHEGYEASEPTGVKKPKADASGASQALLDAAQEAVPEETETIGEVMGSLRTVEEYLEETDTFIADASGDAEEGSVEIVEGFVMDVVDDEDMAAIEEAFGDIDLDIDEEALDDIAAPFGEENEEEKEPEAEIKKGAFEMDLSEPEDGESSVDDDDFEILDIDKLIDDYEEPK